MSEEDDCNNGQEKHLAPKGASPVKAEVIEIGASAPKSKVRHIISELAKGDSSKVFFTTHAEDRMAERAVTRAQVMRCLVHGTVAKGYPKRGTNPVTGGSNWVIKLEVLTAGEIVKVVATLEVDKESGDHVLVVTTYR